MMEKDPKLMHMSEVDPWEIYQLMVWNSGTSETHCTPAVDVENVHLVVDGTSLSRRECSPGGCCDTFYFKSHR